MTAVAVPARARTGRAFRAQLATEARLLVREPAAMIFGAVLPLVANIVMAAIPAARRPLAEWGGPFVVQTYIPVITLFASSILGLTVLPAILGGYREMGVLRRLRTTPVSPANLIAALGVLVFGVGLVVSALLVAIPALFGAGLPAGLGMFSLVAVLSLLAFPGMGAVLAAVIPNPKAAAGVGNVVAALTPRESDVLREIAAGGINREAAARLHISETTLKTHLGSVYEKLGVSDRAAAVRVAYERGLI